MTKITFQNLTQVPLVDHDHMVQAFSANTSDHPFRIAVLPRTPGRYRNFLDTQSIYSCCEIMTVDPVTISHQVARHGVVGKRFHHLLCRPFRRGMICDVEVDNASSVMRQNHEEIQHAELYGRNREEVDRDHLANMISKK